MSSMSYVSSFNPIRHAVYPAGNFSSFRVSFVDVILFTTLSVPLSSRIHDRFSRRQHLNAALCNQSNIYISVIHNSIVATAGICPNNRHYTFNNNFINILYYKIKVGPPSIDNGAYGTEKLLLKSK